MPEFCPGYAASVNMCMWTDTEFMNAGTEHSLRITHT